MPMARKKATSVPMTMSRGERLSASTSKRPTRTEPISPPYA